MMLVISKSEPKINLFDACYGVVINIRYFFTDVNFCLILIATALTIVLLQSR